jgi:predicted dehydrogenase
MIGCGIFARQHLKRILAQPEATQIRVVCEPLAAAYTAFCELCRQAGLEPPPNEPNLAQLLTRFGSELDTATIITPHVFHYEQAKACLEAGLDVLMEKPMVMNVAEAEGLIETRNRTGKTLVVAFPAGFSPRLRTAVHMLRSDQLGPILNISGLFWERWKAVKLGTWRVIPEMAGGGFFFDTGAHVMNIVSELAGEAFSEVSAYFDHRDTAVDIIGVVIGRLKSGALVSLNGCGEACSTGGAEVRVFCAKGTLRVGGAWGDRLDVHYPGSDQFETIPTPASPNVWEQFLLIRQGQLANPCPPEVGLRMAHLWQAIQTSAAEGGRPVPVGGSG